MKTFSFLTFSFLLFTNIVLADDNLILHDIVSKKTNGLIRNNKSDLDLIDVKKIWDGAPHNAFTSLLVYNNKLFCAFREGSSHNSYDGKIRIISSNDGTKWYDAGLVNLSKNDLRDPKLTINSTGELVLLAVSRFQKQGKNKHHTFTWLYSKARWTGPFDDNSSADTWRWGVQNIDKEIYSIAYSGRDKAGTLYKSKDGKKWNIVKSNLFPDVKSFPNENAIVKLSNGKMVCLLRKNNGNKKALLGISTAPFKIWKWQNLDKQIGGPSLIQLPNGELYAALRLYNKVRTSICRLDIQQGKLIEEITLPSGNDTSYPGMVMFNNELWVSYYSNHESSKGKSAIFIARLKLK